MPHDRYYLDADLTVGDSYSLTDDEWHHLVRVGRARVDDTVEIVNGRGVLGHGVVKALHKRSTDIFIESIESRPNTFPEIILALALQKKSHLEWVLEKGTELGASSFWLFPGMRSEKCDVSPSQMQRFKNLTIAAMKQCGRLDLPKIVLKPPLVKFPSCPGTLLFGDVSETAPALWQLKTPLKAPIIFFIGPESGFDPKEDSFLRENLNAQGVRLHPHILRAETAPLVGLSLLQTLFN